ncbi:hypothetical protein ACP4OV_020749 [Aristida adscensionis]
MARSAAAAAAALALAVCFLLVAPAPARRPVDLTVAAWLPDAVDREAAAEPLRLKPADVAEEGTAVAVPGAEEGAVAVAVRGEEPQQRSSLLCLVFRCGGEPAGAVAVAGDGSGEAAELDGWARPVGTAEVEEEEVGEVEDEDEQERLYGSDSDSDWDSDSDDEDEGGIAGWFWRLAHLF